LRFRHCAIHANTCTNTIGSNGDYEFAHFNLLPLFPRRGVGRANDSHYTRIAYNCKNFLNYFSGLDENGAPL
jgi:hypothetical protein